MREDRLHAALGRQAAICWLRLRFAGAPAATAAPRLPCRSTSRASACAAICPRSSAPSRSPPNSPIAGSRSSIAACATSKPKSTTRRACSIRLSAPAAPDVSPHRDFLRFLATWVGVTLLRALAARAPAPRAEARAAAFTRGAAPCRACAAALYLCSGSTAASTACRGARCCVPCADARAASAQPAGVRRG